MHRISVLALLVALRVSAQQQPVTLTLEDALARVRIAEGPGGAAGAATFFPTNPVVEIEAGRRSGEASSTDYSIAVGQELELPERRRARRDASRAGLAQEAQRVRGVEREALRGVATAFLRAMEARERADAAAAGKRLAEEALRIAERRYGAGDVAQLDVNLARTVVARAEAEAQTASAALAGQLAQLQVLLGMAERVAPAGSLKDSIRVPNDLAARAADRPDLRALEAELAEAEAGQRLARTLRRPDFGVRASYAKEEGDRILLGGIGVTLPVFQRGQEAAAIAGARLARLRAERDALARAIEAQVRGAAAAYDALRSAAAAYERTVLPLIDENEQLALESYEVGQIGLGELLLVRREALDARRALVDRLIETRLAEVELRAASGVWP